MKGETRGWRGNEMGLGCNGRWDSGMKKEVWKL